MVDIPDTDAEMPDGGDVVMEEDASDIAVRRRAAAKAREEAELRKRSQVLNLHPNPKPATACVGNCALEYPAHSEPERSSEVRGVQVMQRGLPRPISLAALPEVRPASELAALGPRQAAEGVLATELAALLTHEAEKYPLKDKRKGRKRSAPGPEAPPAPWQVD